MILEVEPTAAPEQIIRSYRRLALKLHPDRNHKQDTKEAFQMVCNFINAILLSLCYLCLYCCSSHKPTRY